jgi:hypothetical protein
MVAMLSAGTAHFVSPVTRVDDAAPVDGCQASANLPNATYVPVNTPPSGGRDPDVAGADATNPVPRTVTVSPAAFKPDVFDTVTVGTAGAGVAVTMASGAAVAASVAVGSVIAVGSGVTVGSGVAVGSGSGVAVGSGVVMSLSTSDTGAVGVATASAASAGVAVTTDAPPTRSPTTSVATQVRNRLAGGEA